MHRGRRTGASRSRGEKSEIQNYRAKERRDAFCLQNKVRLDQQ
jgi:hypothetical protein